jgi:hypothetical protein
MSMRKSEDHHHTSDQVIGYVREAQRICEEVDLSSNATIALLPTLVTLLSSKQVFYEQVGPLPGLAIPNTRLHG